MNGRLCLKKNILFTVASFLFVACGTAEEINLHQDEKNAEIRNGMLIDYRDGKSYGVAKINGLYWMTDNLRYVDSVSMANLRGNSWCHEDDRTCSKFGRLYSWSAAMDADKKFNSNAFGNKNSSVQGICPTGWRLPTKSDIANLTIFVTMNNGGEGTGTSLKSTETWDKSDAARTPTNRFGFNAKASGRRNNDGKTFLSTGRIALFWTAEEKDKGTAYGYQLRKEVDVLEEGNYYKDHGMAVRCVASPESIKITGSLDSSYLDKIPHDYGSLKYEGTTYRTVDIDGLTWMADNLNYEIQGSHCYKDNSKNCNEYGRLYTNELAGKACPDGWRLPSYDDFMKLLQFAKSNTALRSRTGWTSNAPKGLDFWGFDAKPAGGRESGDYFDLNTSAYFWTDSLKSNGDAFAVWINYYDWAPKIEARTASNEFSVRCVKEN